MLIQLPLCESVLLDRWTIMKHCLHMCKTKNKRKWPANDTVKWGGVEENQIMAVNGWLSWYLTASEIESLPMLWRWLLITLEVNPITKGLVLRTVSPISPRNFTSARMAFVSSRWKSWRIIFAQRFPHSYYLKKNTHTPFVCFVCFWAWGPHRPCTV